MAKNTEKKDEIIEVEAEKVEETTEETAVETLPKKGWFAIQREKLEKHPMLRKGIKVGSIALGAAGALFLWKKVTGHGGGAGLMDLSDYSVDEAEDGESDSEDSVENTNE